MNGGSSATITYSGDSPYEALNRMDRPEPLPIYTEVIEKQVIVHDPAPVASPAPPEDYSWMAWLVLALAVCFLWKKIES